MHRVVMRHLPASGWLAVDPLQHEHVALVSSEEGSSSDVPPARRTRPSFVVAAALALSVAGVVAAAASLRGRGRVAKAPEAVRLIDATAPKIPAPWAAIPEDVAAHSAQSQLGLAPAAAGINIIDVSAPSVEERGPVATLATTLPLSLPTAPPLTTLGTSSTAAEVTTASSSTTLESTTTTPPTTSEVATTSLEAACQDAKPESRCYSDAMWAKTAGVIEHPKWYPEGLSPYSSVYAFQAHLHETIPKSRCPKPCTRDFGPASVCNINFEGGSAPDTCFCKLAGNAGCAGMPCSCPQGCQAAPWSSPNTVTFQNQRSSAGCSDARALLTIPRSHFANIWELKAKCPQNMEALMEEMLLAGFNAFGGAPVQQCIHASQSISVSWLHLHTFCLGGIVDGLPPPDWHVAWCGQMQSRADAPGVAKQVMGWATSMYGAIQA